MSNNAQLATGSKYEMPKDALITLICSICFFAANAQTLGKRGLVTPVNHSAYSTILVTDAAGDEPLFGASVKIICKQDTLIRATQKLELGQIKLSVFFYENVPTDSVELRVSYIGYKTFVRKYSALDFKGTKRIQLLDDVMAISQIVVIGEQIAMVIKGDTTIYNALSFKTIEDDRFRELLKQLPGIEVKNNKIYASGEEIKRVYVDGRNFFGDNPEYVLSDLTANDVRSVKIYDQLSAEAKFLGDLNAKQERVMDVVTHSKPDVIQGGMATAMAGSSLDVGKYKNEDLRYEAAGNLFRNTERGNQRIDILLDRNIPSQSSATKTNWGTSPGSTQGINIGNTLRRGDTLSVYTNLFFKRNTQKNLSNSYMNYFPSHTYDLRNQNSFSNSLGDNYTIFVSNKINKLRRGNVFLASIKGELSHANHTGQNYTTQQIDNEQTILDRNLKGYDTGGTIDLRVMNSKQIGSLGFLLLGADFKYSKSKSDNMDVDTMASNNLMRIILNNNTGSNKIHTDVSATFMMKLRSCFNFILEFCYEIFSFRFLQLKSEFSGTK